MDYIVKIDEVIDQALTEKTFSLEIIEKIKSLRDGFDAATKDNERLTELLKQERETTTDLRTQLTETKTRLEAYEKRELELSEKERNLSKTLYELDFQKNRANEIKELFGVVFKNPVVKENVYRNSQMPVSNNGYISTQTSNESETATKEIE